MKAILSSTLFKVTAIIVTVAALVVTAVNVTVAFFTDAKESTGVFTAGSVYIELTESAVKADERGNLIQDTTKPRVSGSDLSENGESVSVNNYGVIFPGQRIFKDPTVTNIGEDKAWVAVKVIIEDGVGDIHKLFGYVGHDEIDVELLLSGGLLDQNVTVGTWNGIPNVCYNDNYAMIQVANKGQGRYEFIFLMLAPMVKGESVEVFDTFTVNPYFGSDEMAELRELKITVQAFAVQEFGFLSCLEAMTTAFPDRFLTGTNDGQ